MSAAGMVVTRITIDLLSPIPIGPLEVVATVARAGRRVQRLEGSLVAAGRVVCRATAVAVRVADVPVPPPAPGAHLPSPAESPPFELPLFRGEPGYATAMEGRLARGAWGQGPAAVWVRARVPLLPGEALSPFQRVLIAADSGSGVAVVVDPDRFTFLNADLTVALHRLPAGEWVGLDAATTAEPTGIGLSTTRLVDTEGSIGLAVQSLVLEPRPPRHASSAPDGRAPSDGGAPGPGRTS